MNKTSVWTMLAGMLVSGGITMQPAHAQSFDTLYGFDGTDGANSLAGVIRATNGIFYGTTAAGGVNSNGTVY